MPRKLILLLIIVIIPLLLLIYYRLHYLPPSQDEKTVELDSYETMPPVLHPEGGQAVPGRLQVQLEPSLWHREFQVTTPLGKAEGLQRLKPSAELQEIFDCYGLKRVWRTMANLEKREGDRVCVISYVQWTKEMHARRGRRENGRDYTPPDLQSVTGCFELEFPEEIDSRAVVTAIEAVPGVVSVHAVVRPIPQSPFFPNDPGWLNPDDPNYNATLAAGRWGFHNTGKNLSPDYVNDFDIDAPEAWEFQRGNPSVVVAVLDDGVDVTHPDLYLNIFLNEGEVPAAVVKAYQGASPDDGLPGTLTFYDLNVPSVIKALKSSGWSDTNTNANGYIDGEDVVLWWSDGVDDDKNGYVDDLVGWDFVNGDNTPFCPFSYSAYCDIKHGTCSAGLIAALGNNAKDIAGVAHRVRILPVVSDFVIAEVSYAISFLPVRVINHSMSRSFPGSQVDINAVFATLEPEGVLYVASLGNENYYTFGSDPSRFEPVMSISNFMGSGYRDQFNSGYGPKTDVAGPGKSMYSTAGSGTTKYGGTSAASPVVAGVAALVASQGPTLTPEQIRQVLRMTAVDPAPVSGDNGENTPGWDLYSGWGLVNASKAIQALLTGHVFAEANILSLAMNYENHKRNEQFVLGDGNVPIRAYLGIPGAKVNWSLRCFPDWSLTVAAVEASNTAAAYSDGNSVIHTINTDSMDGRQVLELEVSTTAGDTSRDRAVIDLLRAYLANFTKGEVVLYNEKLKGFAYGPGFSCYRILVAPGWSPAEKDFVQIHKSTSEQAPTIYQDGRWSSACTLLDPFDIFALPISLPASGAATIRVKTEGSRTWKFDEKIIIDNIQPPHQKGFPLPGFLVAKASPTAADLDADGDLELITAGSGKGVFVQAHHGDGTKLTGFPVIIGASELISHSPAVGDVDGDGRPEIVARIGFSLEKECIMVIEHDGSIASGFWPLKFNTPSGTYSPIPEQNPPVLADVTLDGQLDILVSMDRDPPALPQAVVRAYRGCDASVIRDYKTDKFCCWLTSPVVGDIDGDNEVEIAAVAMTIDKKNIALLYVWNCDGTQAWTAEVYPFKSKPVVYPTLADVNGDGRLEIITGTPTGLGYDIIRIFDGNGTLLTETKSKHFTKPAPAQLRPSVVPDDVSIVFAATVLEDKEWNTKLHVINGDMGSVKNGWSGGLTVADPDAVMQPLIADLQGDADLEIAYGNGYPPSWRKADPAYTLALLEDDGTVVTAGGKWPLQFYGPIYATPLLADLDGDGDLELTIVTENPASRIHVYDLPATDHSGSLGWSQLAHNPRRTGNYHGDIRILSPTTLKAQVVGPPDDVTKQALLLVRTQFARRFPPGGKDVSKWGVVIGDTAAIVSEVQKVQGEYWLLVKPVKQSSAKSYDLKVSFNDGGISTWDAYKNAVIYETPAKDHTQIAVIDRSGSMLNDGKIEAARLAGRFFMESTYPDDEAGVVSFDTIATRHLVSDLVQAGPNRAAIAAAITGITPVNPWVLTSIGAGLNDALDILEKKAKTGNCWGLVLLSDGRQNKAPIWSSSGGSGSVYQRVINMLKTHPDFAIHTISLGPDADQKLLEEIATVGNGRFYPVYLGNSLSLPNRLADVFHATRENIDQTKRLLVHGADFENRQTWTDTVSVVAGTRRLQFAFNWDRPADIIEGERTGIEIFSRHDHSYLPLSIEIIRPNGSLVLASDPDVQVTTNITDAVLTVPAPDIGDWIVRVTGLHPNGVEILTIVSAEVQVSSGIIWGPVLQDKHGPASVLLAYLTDRNGFIHNATLTATITGPDKSVTIYQLHDDGKHGDGAANNGIFGTLVPWELPGSYLVNISMRAESSGGVFQLTDSVGYYNKEGTDTDNDGLPDDWERRFSPKCGTLLHPAGDPDGDGLDNTTEWCFGSNPLQEDTDDDGRTDRTEYREGTNPIDPDH